MTTVSKRTDNAKFTPPQDGGLNKIVSEAGRFPPVTMQIYPIDKEMRVGNIKNSLVLDRFLTYNFNSSILVPVDAFNFSFAAPDLGPFYESVKEGDLVRLYANKQAIATGIIDSIQIETDADGGEKIAITGRDLMAFYEDQDAVSVSSDPLWANKVTLQQVFNKLNVDTRLSNKIIFRDAPQKAYMFATEPGETKLSALMRYLEPLNILVWMSPEGFIICGRPNCIQEISGQIFCIKSLRQSNVNSIRAAYASTQIPNIVVPIWSGQESVQSRIAKEQAVYNKALGPSRLCRNGHRLPKAVVMSTPDGASAQDWTALNTLDVVSQQKSTKNLKVGNKPIAGGANIIQAYALKEMARKNHQEIIVQAQVAGHYNEKGIPYAVDQLYHVTYERASLNEDMYLFQVDYNLSEDKGQTTELYFCRKGSLVAGIRAA